MNIKTALIIAISILTGAAILETEESTIVDYENEEFSIIKENDAGPQDINPKNKTSKEVKEKIVLHPSMDKQRGIPYGYYPLPSSWKIKKEGWIGPKGTKVKLMTSKMMDFSQYRYQSPNQLLTGEVGKMITGTGGKLIKQVTLNDVAQQSLNYAQLISINPMQSYHEAIGIHTERNGIKEYAILKTISSQNQFGGVWYYEVITLKADPSYIEKAINHLNHAFANYKPNMEQVAMYKADEQRKVQTSWTAHHNRMQTNQRNFQTTNRAIMDANNATNDAIMGTYRSSSESFNRSNQSTMNGIYGENTVTNPYDGNQYQTDGMYDRTFMNAFGEQFQTNDQFYEPGTDYNANGYQEVYPNGGY